MRDSRAILRDGRSGIDSSGAGTITSGMSRKITVAKGDGIGPEIMDACLHIMEEAKCGLEIEEIEIGEAVYKRGHSAGIEPSSWDSLRRTKVFFKAPITTPQGGGFKSLNVTVRKTLGLFANIRPCSSYHPFIQTKHPVMDVVIVRENEEDTYAGIEHRQTEQVFQCLKLISRPGCERVVRYAFEYAKKNNRKKVTCFTKDNIMKLTDGLFHQVFDEIAAEYPDIENEHWIVDIGAAKLADRPETFDVIVMPNLYGDILSDVAAQITGSVGLAGSANIGEHVSMFEAIHGSAPRRAGQNLANPSGLLLGGIEMLVHMNLVEEAGLVHNAWLKTIEDGVHTYDVFRDGVSKEKVGTKEFAQAVAARLGEKPKTLKAVEYKESKKDSLSYTFTSKSPVKKLLGVDVFLDWKPAADAKPPIADALGEKLSGIAAPLDLKMISNRGVKVWPEGAAETFCTDHWRCRFMSDEMTQAKIVDLLKRIDDVGLEFIKMEQLFEFDGVPGFSLGQGQ